MKELYTNFQRRSMKQEQGQKVKIGTIQSLAKWLTIETNAKLQERTQNHLSVHVPLLSAPECPTWILTNRGLSITVHHCAKRKKTSMICVSNLHSLPWNITGKAHTIRTTLKRRWIFKRASGNRCLHDAGKNPASSKSSSGSSGGSSNLVSIHPRTKSNYRKRKESFEKTKIRTTIPGWQTCRKHPFETLVFKYVYFDTMIDVTVKKREQRIGM